MRHGALFSRGEARHGRWRLERDSAQHHCQGNGSIRIMAESQESGRPRTAILEAAIGLFGKRGYNGTTMRDIAQQVGVLPGSLYAHISSKETLLDEIVELGIDSFLAIEASLPSNQPVLQRLRHAIKAHVRLAAENPGRSLVVFHQWRFLTGQNLNRAINKRRRYQQLFVKLVDE